MQPKKIIIGFPGNLERLHTEEEKLHHKSLTVISSNPRMLLSLNVIERVMTMAHAFVAYSTEDQDLKVIQMCTLRLFNAFASSYKLATSGYYQKSALIMRDIIEVVYLTDLFRTDRAAITRWRFADKKAKDKEFKPIRVREALDKRDGFTEAKRAERYDMFSVLAGHVNMNSTLMLRPEKGEYISHGPFFDLVALRTTLDEMGLLAVQIRAILDAFFPSDWIQHDEFRQEVRALSEQWMSEVYRKRENAT